MTKNANYSVGEPMPNLGELLIAAREKYGLNKKQMAVKFEFDESTYGRLENGKTQRMNQKEIEKLKKMAPYLGLPYSELLAAAGISSAMKREVFYDFDASEIDYASAIRCIYKADPKLFSYMEGMSKLPLQKIKLVERLIEMLLDEELETDVTKKLIADNVINNLNLYGISETVNWKKAWNANRRAYPFLNYELSESTQSTRPSFAVKESCPYLNMDTAFVGKPKPSPKSVKGLTVGRVAEKNLMIISFRIGTSYMVDIHMNCRRPVDEEEIRRLTQGFRNVRISTFKATVFEMENLRERRDPEWEMSYDGFENFFDLQKAYGKVEELISRIKEYGTGTITLSVLGQDGTEATREALERRLAKSLSIQSESKRENNKNVERKSQMKK